MRKPALLCFATALLVLVCAGTGLAQPLQKIVVGTVRATAQVPHIVGVEKGIYAKYGLDVELKYYTSGVDSLQGLITGDQDVTNVGSVPLLTAVSKGIDVVGFALAESRANARNFEVTSVIASKKSGIGPGEFAKLRGMRIGVVFGAAPDEHIRGLLDMVHIDQKDATLVNMPPARAVTAFKTGDLDVIAVWQPWAVMALKEVPDSRLVVRGAGPCPTCYNVGFMATSRRDLTAKRDLLVRYFTAHAEAMQYARTNVKEVAEIASRWISGVEPEVAAAALLESNMDPRFSKNVYDGWVRATIPFLVKFNYLEKSFDPVNVLQYDIYCAVEKEHPGLFFDMDPIPPEAQVCKN